MTPTPAHLLALGVRRDLAEQWSQPIANACARSGINTRQRLAAFLAQTLHESSHLTRTVENLSYTSAARIRKVWPSRFPDIQSAQAYIRQPERLANYVYGRRMGNRAPNDGWKYRGRGLLQITGRSNYAAAAAALHLPLLERPKLLEEPPAAALSAAWWWQSHGLSLNALADDGAIDRISHAVNGGDVGLDERRALYERALSVLGGEK